MQLAPFFPVLYRLLQPTFPHCLWSGNSRTKEIALTFDDGPHPVYTPQLLKVLDYYAIPASFFWLGACVQRSPTVAKSVCDRGHWLGLHGYDHRSFPLLTFSTLIYFRIICQYEKNTQISSANYLKLKVRGFTLAI